VILTTEYSDSHALQLAFRLLGVGIIERGAFTWILFRHDDYRKALRTSSALDCRCNPEAVVNGNVHSFEEWVRNERERATA
jgi:hypothetical protein